MSTDHVNQMIVRSHVSLFAEVITIVVTHLSSTGFFSECCSKCTSDILPIVMLEREGEDTILADREGFPWPSHSDRQM